MRGRKCWFCIVALYFKLQLHYKIEGKKHTHTTRQKNTIERQKTLILYYSPVLVTARDHRPLYGLILPGALSLKYKKKSAFNHICVHSKHSAIEVSFNPNECFRTIWDYLIFDPSVPNNLTFHEDGYGKSYLLFKHYHPLLKDLNWKPVEQVKGQPPAVVVIIVIAGMIIEQEKW